MWRVPFYHYGYNSEPNRPGPCFPEASSPEERDAQDHLKIKITMKEKQKKQKNNVTWEEVSSDDWLEIRWSGKDFEELLLEKQETLIWIKNQESAPAESNEMQRIQGGVQLRNQEKILYLLVRKEATCSSNKGVS